MAEFENFQQLSSSCKEGKDYSLQSLDRGTPITIFAPHGGGIDLGSSEIAAAIAGEEFSQYLFKGIRPGGGNWELHIKSELFDEPTAIDLASNSDHILAIHSCRQSGDTVYVGGLNEELKKLITGELNSNGFSATTKCSAGLAGRDKKNICNRGKSGAGVQLEICKGLRSKMFGNLASKKGRETRTETFTKFTKVISDILSTTFS